MTLSILDYQYTENQILVLDIDPSQHSIVFLKILVSKLLVQISVSSCLIKRLFSLTLTMFINVIFMFHKFSFTLLTILCLSLLRY